MSFLDYLFSEEQCDTDKKCCELSQYFKLPMAYIPDSKVTPITANIKSDLELVKSNIGNTNKPLYTHLFNPSTRCEHDIIDQWSNRYTSDATYLSDTQHLLKHLSISSDTHKYTLDETAEMWDDYVNEPEFIDKYRYIKLEYFKYLNEWPSAIILMYIAQIISDMIPIAGVWHTLMKILYDIISNFPDVIAQVGKFVVVLIANPMRTATFNISFVIAGLIYVGLFSYIKYTEISSAHDRMKQIHAKIEHIKYYLNYTLNNMREYRDKASTLKSGGHVGFTHVLDDNYNVLTKFYDKISSIESYKWDFNEMTNIGVLMTEYYKCRYDDQIHASMIYSLGFNSYIKNLQSVQALVSNATINFAKISRNKRGKFVIHDNYYPLLVDHDVVKNTLTSDNMIITGPNASGKTTVLKSCLYNILISQQLGLGYYSACKLSPYDFLHCYLNIPDTSCRDSLFQAEARRCKEIYTNVVENADSTHLCIFDELYSGTNPHEATAISYVFIKTLSKHTNISFMMTTHFTGLCDSIKDTDNIKNYHMLTDMVDNNLTFGYEVIEGINRIRGGVHVLEKMGFPEHMIADVTERMDNKEI